MNLLCIGRLTFQVAEVYLYRALDSMTLSLYVLSNSINLQAVHNMPGFRILESGRHPVRPCLRRFALQ